MTKMTVELNITDQLCMDLLTAAVEGGCNYWLQCMTIERDEELNVLRIVGPMDLEDPEEVWPDVTLETMRLGVQRILEGNLVRSDIQKDVLGAVTDEDYSNWDAETADCVLQAGMFNEIVYG
jgi:hypothetical protein